MSLRLELLCRAKDRSCAPLLWLPTALQKAMSTDLLREQWYTQTGAWSTVLCVSLTLLSVSISDVDILESYLLGQEKCFSWDIKDKDNFAVRMCPLWSMAVHKESGCSF